MTSLRPITLATVAACSFSFLLACSGSDDSSFGTGGAAGSGGTGAAGSGGSSAGGTGAQSSGGTTSGGGTSSGGTSSGGSAGAGGGAGMGGGAGSGGSAGSGCTPVTVGAFQLVDTEAGGSSLAYSLSGLEAGKEHVLYVEFFDVAGAQTVGTFDLSKPPDDNYSSCAHCLLAFEDVNGTATAFFQESGTLDVKVPDTSYTGASAGNFMSVKLVQVTLQGSTTTKVPGGRCLELTGGWSHP